MTSYVANAFLTVGKRTAVDPQFRQVLTQIQEQRCSSRRAFPRMFREFGRFKTDVQDWFDVVAIVE
jgi:hypothetical protein